MKNDYKILKVLLDGGLVEKPRNVIFYCTSNRKHLIPREMSENTLSSSISPAEVVEEKISLSVNELNEEKEAVKDLL